jgi:hypothetical protein
MSHSCDLCQRGFGNESSLEIHRSKKHGQLLEVEMTQVAAKPQCALPSEEYNVAVSTFLTSALANNRISKQTAHKHKAEVDQLYAQKLRAIKAEVEQRLKHQLGQGHTVDLEDIWKMHSSLWAQQVYTQCTQLSMP